MKLGIGLPNTHEEVDRDLILTWARRAEEGPFDSLGVFDRLNYHSLEPFQTLGVCAGATESIRLATTIVAGPIRSTALLAKTSATLDVLSDGRLTLGLGLGARKDDYEEAGADYHTRGDRFTEQLKQLRSYWDNESLDPKPVQPGGPEILVGGMSDRAFGRVARFGDGYIQSGGPPKVFDRDANKARAAWNENGRPGEPVLWGHGYFALGEEEAEEGEEHLLDYYAFTGPFAETVAEGLLSTPQKVVQFIRGYEEKGCDHLVLCPTVADLSQIDRLTEIVEGL